MSDTDEQTTPAQETHPPGQQASKTDQEKLNHTIINFNGSVRAEGSTFGVSNENAAGRRRATGKLDHTDITEALRVYVTPHRYDDAVAALAADHVVVLEGRLGNGKRTGAIALLRELTDRPLYVLSPVISLKQLAERDYKRGCGYVVVDRKTEELTDETDFTWRTVRDRVRDDGAYLVVTTTATAKKNATEAVQHVPWEQPDLNNVLRAYLVGVADVEQLIDAVSGDLPDGCRLADIVELAARIASGEDPKAALCHFDASSEEYVREWFDKGRTRREVLEVTALAFAVGSNVRTFEPLLTRLEGKLATSMPVETSLDDSPKLEETLPYRRRALVADDGLIGIDRVVSDGATQRELVFKVSSYHRYVLIELWERMEVAFWDALHEWLDEIVQDEHGLQLADGLAKLAEIAVDEVSHVLESWSDGARGWLAQTAATYVLWLMSYNEALAPVALDTAIRWISRGSPAQRWTAAITFSGELGVRYPHEAANRLWHLITQSHTASGDVFLALSELFATLSGGTQDAEIVLTMLDGKLTRFDRPGANMQLRAATISSVLAVLSARTHTGRSAAFAFMCEFPDKTDILARLWAAVLRHRPSRLRAITALRNGLNDLQTLSSEPVEKARLLGEALANALPPGEHESLHGDFANVQAHHRKDAVPLVEDLLAALARIHQGTRETT
ncbi:MAG: hypothetical protein DLM61_14270 [Pseudonocardiales bacterium]|nr:MAG: hypothetical protein DLM61_14270 [Pseudonocardiales bacterium]